MPKIEHIALSTQDVDVMLGVPETGWIGTSGRPPLSLDGEPA